MDNEAATRRPVARSGIASAIIPGLGQILLGQKYRGVGILLGFLVMLGTVFWYKVPVWYVVPVLIWLWNIWDAASLAGGKARSILLPVAVG